MINLENLLKSQNKYSSRKEEVESNFDDADNWLGVKMEIKEVRKYTWSHKKQESY